MKKAVENESKNLIKLENMEGLWYEQPDILSKYKRRPDELEEMRYTHYAKIFKSGGKENQMMMMKMWRKLQMMKEWKVTHLL